MSYSTGEIAELCGITVRTVQYYDREGLLKPDGLSEGGRRVYGENSLKTMQLICAYKELGLSLAQIKEVLSDEENSRKVLLSVLNERERNLDEEIRQKLSQRESVKVIKQYLAEGKAMPKNSFSDVRIIMKGKTKLRATYAGMLVGGAVADAALIASIVLWAVKGMWVPFAISAPCVVLLVLALVLLAHRNLAYICCECGEKFRPKLAEFFFSAHTPKTRKLTCPHCGKKNFHTETYSD